MTRDLDRVLDEYLVVLAQGGSREAMGQLADRWSPRLYRHVARTLRDPDIAGDVVQDAWLAALRGLRSLDDPARFPAWLYAIATRRCYDVIRGNIRSRRLQADMAVDAAINGHAPRTAGAEVGLDLTAALRALPVDQRLTASLFYGEDLKLDEIAAVLGVPAGTVKSRLSHARRALRTHLKGFSDDPD